MYPDSYAGNDVSGAFIAARNVGGSKKCSRRQLFSGSGGMTQLMSTLNEAYEVRGRSWLRVHLISFGLTIAMSVLIIAALLLVLAGGQVVEVIAAAIGLSSAGLVGRQNTAVGARSGL